MITSPFDSKINVVKCGCQFTWCKIHTIDLDYRLDSHEKAQYVADAINAWSDVVALQRRIREIEAPRKNI
jgi:hypothetical protein